MKTLIKKAKAIGFKTKFLVGVYTIRNGYWDYLWACELQQWLIDEKKIIVNVKPVDSWECWTFDFIGEDAMAPFFEFDVEYKEFTSKPDALKHALIEALNLINK